IAVLISLVFALFLIPVLARFTMRPAPAAGPDSDHEHGHEAGAIERWYVSSLPLFLRRPWIVLLALFLLGGAGVYTYFQIGTGFLPAADEGGFVIDYTTPAGM